MTNAIAVGSGSGREHARPGVAQVDLMSRRRRGRGRNACSNESTLLKVLPNLQGLLS